MTVKSTITSVAFNSLADKSGILNGQWIFYTVRDTDKIKQFIFASMITTIWSAIVSPNMLFEFSDDVTEEDFLDLIQSSTPGATSPKGVKLEELTILFPPALNLEDLTATLTFQQGS